MTEFLSSSSSWLCSVTMSGSPELTSLIVTVPLFIWFLDVCEDGWNFFNGSCYFTSDTCETWTNASTKCRSMGANLVSVRTQEENVFIQHLHNGDRTWIGLNDIATEGFFTWVDGCPDKFRFWATNQPNDLKGNQDCVHTLGIDKGYTWNDVDCSTCHNYTCEKGNKVTIKGPLGLTSWFVERGEKGVQCMLVKFSCKAAWLKTSLAKQAG